MSEIKVDEEYHTLVRPLSEKEYDELKLSIQTHGLLVPIIVNQNGIILDGHNRYQVCQELGIKPVVIRNGFQSKAVEKFFVIESNLKRRHLTDIEKVELGIQLEPLEAELAKGRAEEGVKEGGRGHKKESSREETLGSNEHQVSDTGKARDIVAKKVGISPTTYHRGKTVLEKGSDEIKEDVKAGKTTISAAYEQVKGRKKKTTKPSEASDILMLPKDKFDITKLAIDQAIADNDKQVVLRHNKHQVTGVGKEIEIST